MSTQPHLACFWRKLHKLTRGRIDVLRAMEICIKEESDADFRSVLEAVYSTLRSGTLLSEALDKQPEVFSVSVRELVRSAERSGAWDDILPIIAEGLTDETFD